MKLLSFSVAGKSSYGVISDDGAVIDSGTRSGNNYVDLRDVLRHGTDAINELTELAANTAANHNSAKIRYQRPILYPEKTICGR